MKTMQPTAMERPRPYPARRRPSTHIDEHEPTSNTPSPTHSQSKPTTNVSTRTKAERIHSQRIKSGWRTLGGGGGGGEHEEEMERTATGWRAQGEGGGGGERDEELEKTRRRQRRPGGGGEDGGDVENGTRRWRVTPRFETTRGQSGGRRLRSTRRTVEPHRRPRSQFAPHIITYNPRRGSPSLGTIYLFINHYVMCMWYTSHEVKAGK